MKKILAFLALASLAQLALATDFGAAAAQVSSGDVINSTGGTNQCAVLSTAEPAVTINLSRDVLAAIHCNATANAAGAATQHPAGRPAACNSSAERCGYMATTAGGPVSAFNAGTTVPTAAAIGTKITGCATYIAAHTSGSVAAACS